MTPAQHIEADGYYVARDLLSRDEVARLRAELSRHFPSGGQPERLGRYQGGLPCALPGLAWIFHHPGIVTMFRELLGTREVVFSGNGHANLNLISKWHRDTQDKRGGVFVGDYFARPECRVYRAAIYLQDHTDGLGLRIRRGSHRVRDATGLPADTLLTRTGDVIFFDYRTEHSGVLPDTFERAMIFAARTCDTPAWLVNLNDWYWKVTGKPDKLAIFFAFGTPGPDSEDFCRFEMGIRRERVGAEHCTLPAPLQSALKDAGVLTYEAALETRMGPHVLAQFAATGVLPGDRVWS
ncbi:hypothetical protein [Emcibacter sp. SYSU 3D8]|uniref:hypothetical protein n=1 Tax=Emcibacter sp. SYSU 3D8 TaxID=3133969 RepID=UPI0031FF31CC